MGGGYSADQAVRGLKSHTPFEGLTRVGFGAKGIVYIVIGVLAVMTAFHQGGETTDQRGVLSRIAEQPFGEIALAIVAAGLFAYMLWRVLNGVLDLDSEGSNAKALAKRAGSIGSGIVYGSVALAALALLSGDSGGAHAGGNTQTWTARLMNMPFGQLLVAIAGMIAVGAGIHQVRKGAKVRFLKHLRTQQMSATELNWAERLGKLGYSARGVVFSIVGVFILYAALTARPGEARGLEGVLDTLAVQPFGQVLLALVAAGLACYGVYSLFEARYRRI